MKCPLFRTANIAWEFDSSWDGDDCLKEECAWWDKHCQSCSVYEISRSLMHIFDIGVEIKEKMPHEGQFRK